MKQLNLSQSLINARRECSVTYPFTHCTVFQGKGGVEEARADTAAAKRPAVMASKANIINGIKQEVLIASQRASYNGLSHRVMFDCQNALLSIASDHPQVQSDRRDQTAQ